VINKNNINATSRKLDRVPGLPLVEVERINHVPVLRTTWIIKLVLVAASIMATLVAAEIGIRLARGKLTFRGNFLNEELNLFLSATPAAFDPALGWIPRAGVSGAVNAWKTQVNITADSLRSNGVPRAAPCQPGQGVLAVGDSFTFGDEVSDHESWPAHLEAISGRCVFNCGVFGYGLDQAVLRAEVLWPTLKPGLLIVGLFYGDIHRCELSMLAGVNKPYFNVDNGALVLENRQVAPPTKTIHDLNAFQRYGGHSIVVHKLMKRLAPLRWISGTMETRQVHTQGAEVALILMDRLAHLREKTGAPILVVALYDRLVGLDQTAITAPVLARARHLGLWVLDLAAPLRQIQANDPAKFKSLFKGHMTSNGNRFVADAIDRFLLDQGFWRR
jgi:hypothetical protein